MSSPNVVRAWNRIVAIPGPRPVRSLPLRVLDRTALFFANPGSGVDPVPAFTSGRASDLTATHAHHAVDVRPLARGARTPNFFDRHLDGAGLIPRFSRLRPMLGGAAGVAWGGRSAGTDAHAECKHRSENGSFLHGTPFGLKTRDAPFHEVVL